MSERHYVKTLNPYSRMALVVRGWGLEVVLALGIFVLWRVGVALDGEGTRGLGPGLGGLGDLAQPNAFAGGWPRRCGTGRRARWFARVLVACEVISRHGLIPRVEGTEAIPAGRRLRSAHAAGVHRRACSTRPPRALAATIGAREVRVVREPANASLAHVSILWRDPLSVPAPPWPGPPGLAVGAAVARRRRGRAAPSRSGCPSATCSSAASPERASRWPSSLFIAAAALDPSRAP